MTRPDPKLEALAAEPAESVVRTYLERWSAHDVEGMTALLSDGPVFIWTGSGIHRHRDSWFRQCAWPMAAGFEIEGYELEVEDDETVHATIRTTTRVHQLLGVALPRSAITFVVVDGIIEKVAFEDPPEDEEAQARAEYHEAVKRVSAWAKEHRPKEAEDLFFVDSALQMLGKTIHGRRHRARRQILLLEDYRNAVELAVLTKDRIHSLKWNLEVGPEGGGTAILSAWRLDHETGETVPDNRRLGFHSLDELPSVLAEIIEEDGREMGEWRRSVIDT